MKLSIIASICESVYLIGAGPEKLSYKDFAQMVKAASGGIIRKMFYEERQSNGETSSFFSTMIELKEMDIIVKGREKSVDLSAYPFPKGLGVFNVFPVPEDENEPIDYENAFTRTEPGSAWLYTPSRLADLGISVFTLRAGSPVLFCSDDIKRVAVEGIFRNEDMDVPDSVAWEICISILGLTLKIPGITTDMTQDGNPNVDAFKSKIASAQPLQ